MKRIGSGNSNRKGYLFKFCNEIKGRINMYKQVVELLEEAAISYTQYTHEPILDYETDRKIRERFKLEGVPSKSLF